MGLYQLGIGSGGVRYPFQDQFRDGLTQAQRDFAEFTLLGKLTKEAISAPSFALYKLGANARIGAEPEHLDEVTRVMPAFPIYHPGMNLAEIWPTFQKHFGQIRGYDPLWALIPKEWHDQPALRESIGIELAIGEHVPKSTIADAQAMFAYMGKLERALGYDQTDSKRVHAQSKIVELLKAGVDPNTRFTQDVELFVSGKTYKVPGNVVVWSSLNQEARGISEKFDGKLPESEFVNKSYTDFLWDEFADTARTIYKGGKRVVSAPFDAIKWLGKWGLIILAVGVLVVVVVVWRK